MRIIEELKEYPPIYKIFQVFKDERYAVFLDSSLHNKLGKYSIIGLYPYMELVKGDTFTLNGKTCATSFEDYLREYLIQNRDINDTGLPIVSGAIGYFSYDYGIKKAGITSRHEKRSNIPDSILCFYDVFIIEDHRANTLYLIANGHREDSRIQIENLKEIINNTYSLEDQGEAISTKLQVETSFTKADYMKAIQKLINYITEGTIDVVNMTKQLKIISRKNPYDFYNKLRHINPSPFAGYFNYGDFQIISASPERFLQMQNNRVVTRPIKGTRKRGTTCEEDQLLKLELQNSEKDRKELLSIVNLLKDDLNKVCVPGTVEVTEAFSIEEYATLYHLVSNITGELRSDLTVMDLIEATFPGASITGAPRLRAMEIIDEVEIERRNIYTGSMGYITLDGACDLNIIIRTAIHHKGLYQIGVGGGITSESDLEFEYEETLQKAKALLEALS